MKIDRIRGVSLALNVVFAGWLLVYLALAAAPTWLFVEITSEKADVARVFVKHDGIWDIARSAVYPVQAGTSRLAFKASALGAGDEIRFDPGNAPRFEVRGLRWHSGFVDHESSLAEVRAIAGSARVEGSRVVAEGNGAGIQLLLPAMPAAKQLLATASVFVPALLLFGFLAAAAWRRRIGPVAIASAYVAATGIVYAYYCLHLGSQLPVFDDWRYVLPGAYSLIDGHWNWLLATGNDTYFLTGQIIDYLCLTLYNVDFMPIRWVALGLLALNVWWMRRIIIAISGEQAAFAAIAVMLCAWSFVGGRLWGGTAMAYHQALPTLFNSLILMHLVGPGGSLRPNPRHLLLLGAAVASGLAYISGGMMVIAMAAATLVVGIAGRDGPAFRALRTSGIVLLVAGTALMAFQLAMVGHYQGSLVEHNHAAASVYPNDRRFWLSLIAQFGMALGYAGTSPVINTALTVVAILPAAAVLVAVIRRWRGGQSIERPGLILAILYAAGAASLYAGVVAFGRAGFIDAAAAAADVIAVAKSRLLFWPISALVPLFFLGWVEACRGWDRRHVVVVVMAIALLLPKSEWPMDLVRTLDPMTAKSLNGAFCIAEKLQAGAPSIVCPDASGNNAELAPGLQAMQQRNAKLISTIENTAIKQ